MLYKRCHINVQPHVASYALKTIFT